MSEDADVPMSHVGEYVLDAEIGKGSFAQVYRAHHAQPPHAMVAVKSVTRSKLSAKLLENLEGEISILKAMRHTNIVDLRDCIYTDAHIHLIMEYCPGGDLSLYIRKHGDVAPWDGDPAVNPLAAAQRARFPHPEDGGLNDTMVRSFLAQLVSAVRFLRSKDIVHRDIKPQNLLLQLPDDVCLASGHPREIPQIKVADFGFARSLPAASLAKTLCGSPLYMAPEILRYEKYDAKADLWSLGSVLYEMCVGRPPFRATNHVELLRRIEQSNDRIKFPDERSAQSLARDAMRRKMQGEAPRLPPHEVASDIKDLIRRLLKRHPVERMSFDELFTDPVVTQVPYAGRAIIKDELAASVHIAQLPPDMLSPPGAPAHMSPEAAEAPTIEAAMDTCQGEAEARRAAPPSASVAPAAHSYAAPAAPSPPAWSAPSPPWPNTRSEAGAQRLPNTAVGFEAPPAAAAPAPDASEKRTRTPNPSALSRAISMAGDRKPHASPTHQPAWSHAPSDGSDEELLELLRGLAKKAYVLLEFADTRFAEVSGALAPCPSLSASPATSSPSSGAAHMQEMAAAESLALYLRGLEFLQRGLDAAHQRAAAAPHAVSPEARQRMYSITHPVAEWFRSRFHEGYEHSLQARAHTNPGMGSDPAQYLDRIIFDKALELARAAALEELEGHQPRRDAWDPTHCVLAYETAASLLLGLLDPGEERMGLSAHSVSAVEKFLQSITKRLGALQAGTPPLAGPAPASPAPQSLP